jgi:ribosome-binding protein aMBF1 (putative translation factor)
MIRNVEKAEAELEGLRVSDNQITTQYRSGRISKDAYESISKDYKKRIEKARETIDSVIVTLREEAR